jgi:hypothetical protein
MDRILYQSGQGLGDWLVNSTLPELFSKRGDDVYLSSECKFNNDQIKDLILKNPYIKGVKNEPYNIGSETFFRQLDFSEFVLYKVTLVWLREFVHNFEPVNSTPVIYYQPKFRKEFMDKTLIDFNSITWAEYYDFEKMDIFISENQNNLAINDKTGKFKNNYITKDIYEYIDILYSCKKFICLNSGGNTLVSAIKRFRVDLEVDVYSPPQFDGDILGLIFRFPNINYTHF